MTHALTKRHSFAKIDEVMEMPNLIEIQRNSYKWVMEEGLKETFSEVSPITDFTGMSVRKEMRRTQRPCV